MQILQHEFQGEYLKNKENNQTCEETFQVLQIMSFTSMP